MPDVATTPDIIFTGETIEWQKGDGWTLTQNWEGTDPQTTSKQAQLVAAGASRVSRSPKGNGAWTVRGMFPFNPQKPDSNYVDVMELETSAIARSVFQSPVLRKRFSDYVALTGTSDICDAACQIVADLHRKYAAGLPKQETTGASTGKFRYFNGTAFEDADSKEQALNFEFTQRMTLAGITGDDRTAASYLLRNLDQRGVTSFLDYNTVFRRRVTAGTPNAIRANFEGAGMIWTTAELIAWESIPNDGWFDLDPSAQWHKDKPRVIAAYGQKTQISYSYTQITTASWLLYEAYGDAIMIDEV